MKKLFTSMLLLVVGAIMAHADELKVCGQTVNLNATTNQTITGNGITGTITYIPSEKRLNLTNVTIDYSGIAIKADVTPGATLPLRVYLTGKNTIKTTSGTPVRADNDIMFCGNGDLDIQGPQGMFINESKLTVYACRVSINSTGDGIYGWSAGNKSNFKLDYHGAMYIKCAGKAVLHFNAFEYSTGELLSGSMSGKELMVGENYHLAVNDIPVTPFNHDNVTGTGISGSVKATLVNNGVKLYLENANISGANFGIDYNNPTKQLTIDIKGNNNITATTRGITGNGGSDREAINIEGDGKLTVKAATGISHQGNLNIKNCTLDLQCTTRGVSLWDSGQLTVDNATIHATGSSSYGAIGSLKGVTYGGGCMPTIPLACIYNSSLKGFANSPYSSAHLVTELTIEPTYGIVICGIPLTKAMGSSMFQVSGYGIHGSVEYDPTYNILYMNDASLSVNGVDGYDNCATIIVYDFNGDKTATGSNSSYFSICALTGVNKINCKEGTYSMYAIISENDLYFFGNAQMDINSTTGINMAGSGHYFWIAMGNGGLFNNRSYNRSIWGSNWQLRFNNNKGTCRFIGEVRNTFEGLKSVSMGESKWLAPSGVTYDSSQETVVIGSTPVQNQWVVVGKEVENYGLSVFGTALTNLNYPDPLGDKSFAYDPQSKTLDVLKSVSNSSQHAIQNNSVDGLTVNFANNRTLEGYYGLYTDKNTTITSSVSEQSSLRGNSSNGCGIYVREGAKLTIKEMNLDVQGHWGIAGNSSDPSVMFDHCNVTAQSSSAGCVVDFGKIESVGCGIKIPANAQIKNKAICDASGNVVTDKVVISTDVTAIEAVEIDNNAEVKAIYDAAGRQTTKAQRGLNIIRMSDGTVRKVMVK